MKRLLFLLLFGFCIAHSSRAQVKIGDNPQTIDAASVLELESTDKVLVITRVTTAQMNAIVPLQGAMVYNTDLQSVHYFDGAQWVNIGGGGGGSGGALTADPIVNDVPTIVITPTGTSDNLEVAENSIGTLQITNGGVNGTDDIQDNSIGSGKLQDQSVTQEKLSENSVGAFALDNDNIGVSAFNNDIGYITSANIVSVDANNALQIGTDEGAFFDETPLISAIQDNTIAINNIGIPNINEVLQEGNNAFGLKIAGLGSPVDPADATNKAYVDTNDNQNIGPVTFDAVTNELSIGIQNGNPGTVNLGALAGGGGGATVINSTTTVTVAGTGTTGDPYELTAVGGGGGTTEVVDGTLLTGLGTAANPFTIAPGAADQILRTNAAGDAVAWVPLPTGAAAITDATIDGDGSSAATALGLADDAVTIDKIAPGAADQILRTNAAGDAVAWVPLPTGGAAITDATIDGDGSSAATALSLADDAVTTVKIQDANVTEAKIAPGGPDEILRTNSAGDAVAWVPLPTGGAVFTDSDTIDGDGSSLLTALTLADEAVTLPKIAPNGATNDGDIMKWNTDVDGLGNAGWEVGVNAGHLGNFENNIFFAGPGGVPIDTEDTPTAGDNGGLIWDPSKRFGSGALYVGYKANGNSGGTSVFGDHSKLAVAERLPGDFAFPLQVVNEYGLSGFGAAAGILFTVDDTGLPGGGGLVFERVGAVGQGDFHFLASAAGVSSVPDENDKVLTVENDGDVVLMGNLVDKNNIGATPPAVGATEDGYVLTNTPGGTVWAPVSGGGSDDQNDTEVPLATPFDFDGDTTNETTVSEALLALQGITGSDDQNDTEVPLATPFDFDGDTTNETTVSEALLALQGITGSDDQNDTEVPLATPFDFDGDTTDETTVSEALLALQGITGSDDQNDTEVPLATPFDYDGDTTNETTVSEALLALQGIAGSDDQNDTEVPLATPFDFDGDTTDETTVSEALLALQGIAGSDNQNDTEVPLATPFDFDGDTTDETTVSEALLALASISGGDNLFSANGLILPANRTHNLNGNNIILGGSAGGSIGIGDFGGSGPASIRSKFDVDGQITASNGFAATEGTQGNPGYGFFTNGDTDTGMFRAGENRLAFTTNSTEAIEINASGNLGIGDGNNAISEKLHVFGNIRTEGVIKTQNGSAGAPSYTFENDLGTGMYSSGFDVLNFATTGTEAMRIDAAQSVGIGLTAPLAKLHVAGNIRADGSFISGTTTYPDYVFQYYYNGESSLDRNYKLAPLNEVEDFIKENHHLPGIKSASEVQNNNNQWNLTEGAIKNLEKIEELFLHTIEQEHKIKKLETDNQALSDELKSLQKDLKEIKALLQNN